MMKGKRAVYRLWWLLAAAALAVAGVYWAVCHRARPAFDPAPFAPDVGQVAALREAAKGANVVLVVIDAARADHVGCYGYPRDTTPNIDRLAESSVVFEWHFSQTTETKSSTACLFTSQYADTNLADGPRPLIHGTFTMAEGFQAAGLRTALFSSNLKASPLYGIGDDFQDSVWDRQLEALAEEWESHYSPTVLLRALSNWLDDHANSRFFAYVHFLPPHYPYHQPSEMTELFTGLESVNFEPGSLPFPERVPPAFPTPPPLPEWINLYDSNLRWGDWAVGEVEALLRERGILDNALLIVTADHGEGFGEHGHPWHGRSVYDEVCHIPLLIKFPGNALAGKRIGALTESVDLLPTIFDLLRIPHPREGIQGQSLLPLLAGGGGSPAPYVYSRAGGSPSKYLVRSKDYALILYNNARWRSLYDLTADPTQKHNIAGDKGEVVAEMVEAFRRFAETQRRPPMDFLDPDAEMPPLPEVPEIEMSPEDRARVNAIANLGYLR